MKILTALSCLIIAGFAVQATAATVPGGKGPQKTNTTKTGETKAREVVDPTKKEEKGKGLAEKRVEDRTEAIEKAAAGKSTKTVRTAEDALDALSKRIGSLTARVNILREKSASSKELRDLIVELDNVAAKNESKEGRVSNRVENLTRASLDFAEAVATSNSPRAKEILEAVRKTTTEAVEKGYDNKLAEAYNEATANAKTMGIEKALDAAIRRVTNGRGGIEEFIKCLLMVA